MRRALVLVIAIAGSFTSPDAVQGDDWEPMWIIARLPIQIDVDLDHHGHEGFEELTDPSLKDVVELGLRRNGIITGEDALYPRFQVDVSTMRVSNSSMIVYNLEIAVFKWLLIPRHQFGDQYVRVGFWEHGFMGYGTLEKFPNALRQGLSRIVDEFSLDYLRAGDALVASLAD